MTGRSHLISPIQYQLCVVWDNLPVTSSSWCRISTLKNENLWDLGAYWQVPVFWNKLHYSDVMIGPMATPITSLTLVYSTVYSRRRSKKTSKLCITGPLCGEFTGEFPSQRPVTRSFDVFFDLHLKKRLSKQWWGWWFETHRRHNDITVMCMWCATHAHVCYIFGRLIDIISTASGGMGVNDTNLYTRGSMHLHQSIWFAEACKLCQWLTNTNIRWPFK